MKIKLISLHSLLVNASLSHSPPLYENNIDVVQTRRDSKPKSICFLIVLNEGLPARFKTRNNNI